MTPTNVGSAVHLEQHDVAMAMVAPLSHRRAGRFRQRTGWSTPWGMYTNTTRGEMRS
ncbi:MAG: DUF899 family protein [Actinomycetota bacterium]|nr:DUF899 family protein [Actinomycetota bacterium]